MSSLGTIRTASTLAHGGEKFSFDAVLGQGDLAIRGEIELDGGRIVDSGDDVVFIYAAFQHVDDFLIG